MRPGFFYYRRRMDRRAAVRILLLFFISLVLFVILYATAQLRPLLESLAVTRVSNTVNRIVAEAVDEAIQQGDISYEQLISFEKDTEGRVTAVHSNMAAFNRLQSRIADSILQRLSEVSTRELEIPVGTLTGSSLLAGRGPCIRIRMQAVGSTTAKLRNAFTAAGINQTKHQILLDVTVQMSILLPGFRTSTQVSNEITVAETIIIGSVPDTYTYFSTTPEEAEQYAEDYIMNNG